MTQLQITTPSELEIRIVRAFAAPRRLVFDAHTSPELMQRWMGIVGGWSWAACAIDLRPDGAYRYVWREPGGGELILSGVFREVVVPERIVMTQVYENMPDFPGEMLVTARFEEAAGVTTLEMTVRYPSRAQRDRDLQQAPVGLEAGYQVLDELLAAAAEA